MTIAATPKLRRHLEPGDANAIAGLHRRVFCEELMLVPEVASVVRNGVRASAARGWPEAGGVWLAEMEGRLCGSLGLTFEGEAGDGQFIGQIKWLALELELRGTGLARRLFEELFETAEDQGMDRLELYTLGEFGAATTLYRSYGFELAFERQRFDLRRDGTAVTYQQYVATV